MAKELKGYELRATKRPAKPGALSTTVAIRGADGLLYYCYVSFSAKLTSAVGKKLPRGISEFDPAYLFVDCNRLQYDVWARYARNDEGVILWSGSLESPPAWLNFYKVKNDGRPQKSSDTPRTSADADTPSHHQQGDTAAGATPSSDPNRSGAVDAGTPTRTPARRRSRTQ